MINLLSCQELDENIDTIGEFLTTASLVQFKVFYRGMEIHQK